MRVLPLKRPATIRWRLIVSSLLAVGLPLVVFASVSGSLLWQFYLRQLEQELVTKANVIVGAVAPVLSPRTPDDPKSLAYTVDLWRRYSDMRVTVADSTGAVQAATVKSDVGRVVEDVTRPGMRSALTGLPNHTVWRNPQFRYQDTMYVNLPVYEDGKVIGAVRVSYTLTQIQRNISRIRLALSLGLGTYGLLIVALTFTLAGTIAGPVEDLNQSAQVLAAGDLSHRVQVKGPVEVLRLGETLNRLAERVQQLEGVRRRYVSNVSHELRTPLASIRGLAETLLVHGDTDPGLRSRYLPRIIAQTERLARLATQLLDLALGETDDLVGPYNEIRLEEVLEEVAHTAAGPAASGDVHISVAVPEPLTPLRGDRDRLVQLFLNLVDNAVHHTPPGGRVAIRAASVPGGVQVVVEDTGVGIAPEDLPYVFERFYRAETVRRRQGSGTGLGLSIVRQIVDAHHGEIEVSSERERGTRVVCFLPATPFPDELPEKQPRAPQKTK